MHNLRSLRRSSLPRTRVLWAVAVLAVCSTSAAVAAVGSTAGLGGTWSGKYSGAYTGNFTLHWTQSGSKLRGSITLSNPHGAYSITGSVSGHKIKFGTVGAGAKYTGALSSNGTSMSGRWTSPAGGGTWSAQKKRK